MRCLNAPPSPDIPRARTRIARWSGVMLACVLVIGLATTPHAIGANDGGSAAVAAALDDPRAISVSDTGLLDVHVREMSLATFLELLSYETRTNIVTTTSVTGNVSANLYDVTLERVLGAVLTPNQYAHHSSRGTIFVGTADELQTLRPPPVTRVFKLRYIDAAEAAEAIKAILGQDANVVEGGSEDDSGGGGGQSGGNAEERKPAGLDYVIVTADPANLQAVQELLDQIDQRPRQVLIEATILRATLREDNRFGIDFTLLGGVDFENVGSSSNASSNLITGPLPSGDLQHSTFNVNTDFSSVVGDAGMTIGVIRNGIAGFIRALEDVTDVVVVANPKIIALNKQESSVIVGRRDGYLTTTVTETAAIQTVEFLETGTQILFRPYINENGTVRLFVHPKDSNGGLTAANLPFEETTEAQANIIMDDGNTVLIGGLFRERTVASRTQIPVLGDIPLAGAIFRGTTDETTREEVVILLTIHVLEESDREQQYFASLVEDVERLRVGCRRGLLGSGRERLAQAYFHEALRQYERGEEDLARLNLRMTLNNEPKMLPAIKLLEELQNERLWDDEATRMRTFIWKLIDERPDALERRFGRPRITAPPVDAAEPVETSRAGYEIMQEESAK